MTRETVRAVIEELVTTPLPHWRIDRVGLVIPQNDRDCVRVTLILEIDT